MQSIANKLINKENQILFAALVYSFQKNQRPFRLQNVTIALPLRVGHILEFLFCGGQLPINVWIIQTQAYIDIIAYDLFIHVDETVYNVLTSNADPDTLLKGSGKERWGPNIIRLSRLFTRIHQSKK